MSMTCRVCGISFSLSGNEIAAYQKFGFDPLSECFQCNQKHKLTFRNGRMLYRRTCDATGENIISIYAPQKPYKVYKTAYWLSDQWDAAMYGRDFDFNRPFFEQYAELQSAVPRMALMNINAENSDYCNMTDGNKNCYLVFGGDYNEDTMYAILAMHNRMCLDCDFSNNNDLCYALFNSFHCYDCRWTMHSKNCNGCAYITDCIGCTDCILCANLANQSFCIMNEKLSKEEYVKRKQELITDSWRQHEKNLAAFQSLSASRIVKTTHMVGCEDCSGDYMESSKHCKNCFFAWNSQDVLNGILIDGLNDAFQTSFSRGALAYNSLSMVNSSSTICCYWGIESNDAYYSELFNSCSNVFGCNGLRHKSYCILNKQYSKEEYEVLFPQIVDHMQKTGEWGEFFPKNISCFGYNEGTAQEFFPMEKEQARREGFSWFDEIHQQTPAGDGESANDLPDATQEITDDILHKVISSASGRPFKIQHQELDFYRRLALPLPHLHPDERYYERMQFRNPFVLCGRQCMKCGKEMQTTYAPDRPEIVYCEECYLKTVY